MTPEPTSEPLDLLVVGGLTIDRFADGTDAPGGAVVHITRAASQHGLRVGVVTAAGPEPVAAAAVTELHSLAAAVEVTRVEATITYRHQEAATGRRLWLERAGGHVAMPRPELDHLAARALLFAPVAGEVDTAALRTWDRSVPRGAILQGWLRSVGPGGEVVPLALAELGETLRTALGDLDLLIASAEDLRAESTVVSEQLSAMRTGFGPTPVLVVTQGVDGLWIDHPGALEGRRGWRTQLAVPQRVQRVPTVGAGDILAAFLTIGAKLPESRWRSHAEDAMGIVASELAARARG